VKVRNDMDRIESLGCVCEAPAICRKSDERKAMAGHSLAACRT
jgi:hypothetical protein